MDKTNFVHRINNYDLEERSGAFWKGYLVEFTYEEGKKLQAVQDLQVIEKLENSVIVQFQPKKSAWEEMFK